MRPEKALSWYRRMSVLYGLGAWTLLGSLFLWNQRKSKPPERKRCQEPDGSGGGEVEQKDVSTNELSEPPKGFYVETIVTYRDDFVPLTARIVNYLKSWTGGPGTKS